MFLDKPYMMEKMEKAYSPLSDIYQKQGRSFFAFAMKEENSKQATLLIDRRGTIKF